MAIKIPDAPNVIGTQPVLREIDSINPVSERPNFKVDVSAPAEAIKNVGNAYADYVEYNTNIWMGAACNQFTHDLLSEEQRLKDTHTELQANDLYSKLEKYATGVLDDMTGAPKDDGRVRIANPELKKRFRDWASKQMPAYQSRMMNYTASELDKANTKILKQGIEDTNKFIIGSSYETAAEEFNAAWPSYVRAAQLSAPGMPKEYQMAEAARMMDEAVYAKMKMLADNSIPEALQWYYGVPAVNKALSSKSKAAFFDEIEKNYVNQGGARVAEDMASGGSGAEPGGYLDYQMLRAAFPGKSDSELGAIYAKVYDKGREINDARIKAQQGMREQQLSSVQGKTMSIDINDQNAVAQTYLEYHNVDPQAADTWFMSVQKDLADKKVMDDFRTMFPNGDPRDDLVAADFDEEAYEKEYNDLKTTYRQSKGYFAGAGGVKFGPFDTRNPGQKQIDEDFQQAFGSKKDYIQRRKDAFLYGSDMSPLTQSEIEDLAAGRPVTRANVTSDTNFRPNENPALSAEQIDMLNRYDKVIEQNSAWVNSPVYAEYVAKAGSGEYHGEDVPELRGLPLSLRNNLSQTVYYNDRYNEVIRLNPHLDDDLKARIKDPKKKGQAYLGNVKREAVKAFDRYRQQGNSFPVRDSIEYETILNTVVKNAESPTKMRAEQYLNSEAADYLAKQKINPYLDPSAAWEALDDVDALPLNMRVAKKIKDKSSAEDWAESIIDALPSTVARRVRPYKPAMVKHIEDTGNADVWYQFIDGIGQQQ